MFYNATAEVLPQIDTSSGTNFGYMYYGAKAENLPEIDTSNGTNLSYMYSNSKAKSFPEINTSKVTSINGIYYNCSEAERFPEIDTSKCTSLTSLYSGCSKAKYIPTINTDKATSLSSMFYNCYLLPKTDITYFNLTSTYGTSGTFSNCYSLKAIIIRSFGSGLALYTTPFQNCYHILGTTNSSYNPTGAKDGYIYVPRSYIYVLSSATTWSTYASQLRALEDYTKDGTCWGEFDDVKAGL
jgi:hypothetical protein